MTHDTKKVLKDMMNENTGRHLLDSGDAYGRNFERNRQKNLEKQPAMTMNFHKYGDDDTKIQMWPTIDTYHYLSAHLEYNETAHKLNKQFQKFVDAGDDTTRSWLQEMREWTDTQSGNEDSITINTYSEEFNHLSQVLQFIPFTLDYLADEPSETEITKDIYGNYIILQLHNGADIRGGYTKPVIFKVNHDATALMSIGDNISLYDTDNNEFIGEFIEYEMELNIEEIDELELTDDGLKHVDGHELEFRAGGFGVKSEIFEVN